MLRSCTDVKSQLALSSRQRKLRAAAELHSNTTKHAVKLSVRTATGGAEIHAHYDDIFLSRREKQLWFTWETVVKAKTDSDCGTKGSSIRNGRLQNLVHGDIVHIPAGTPHRLIIAGGTMFGAVVVT